MSFPIQNHNQSRNTGVYDLNTMRLFENVLNSDSTNRSRLQSINSYLQTFSLKHKVDTEISTKEATIKLILFQIRMGAGNGKPVLRDEDVNILTKSSGLTEQQVRETFDTFIVEHPDGKFDKKEFSAMMQKALPKKDALKMEKHIFRYKAK